DWSSDVCSSDLAGETVAPGPAKPGRASLRATRRVDLSAIARRVSRPEPPAEDAGPLGQVLVAAADVPGIATGAPFRSWHDVAEATIRRFAAMPRGDRPGAPSKRMTYGLAQIVKPDTGLNLQRYNSEQELIDHAADEARLTGGSLVAAGGWCGPAERWTDLCPELDSMDGLFDLPEVTVTRGVVQYLQSPDYCAMWDMVTDGFFGPMTSEQVDAGEEKPCVEIPCPDEWLECSQEAYGLCITAGILTNKSYPEWVSRFLRFALRAHARRMSAVKLKAVYDGSDDLGMPELGAGATASVLNAIELEVEWVRYRNRLARNASLEMVAPYWIRPAIRADLANREGLDVFAVTDQQITAWFSRRGVRVQWVYAWQPLAGCDQPSPDGLPGPATPITAYPERVEFLLYPAGTWVAAAQDIITIDTLYDSTLMRRNRYTALFTEEALCVVQRCTGSYRFSVAVCPNGAIGQRVEVPCATGTSPSESYSPVPGPRFAVPPTAAGHRSTAPRKPWREVGDMYCPSVLVDPPTITPYRYGLFSVASIPPEPIDPQWQCGGYEYVTHACSEASTWDPDCESPAEKPVQGALSVVHADPFVVLAGPQCDLISSSLAE